MDDDLLALEDMMDSWMGRGPAEEEHHSTPRRYGATADGDAHDHDLRSYVVSKVSGRPLALPSIKALKDPRSGGGRKVYGYQEPSAVMRAARRNNREEPQDPRYSNDRLPQVSRTDAQMDPRTREISRMKRSAWNDGPSNGIPSLHQVRTRSSSHRAATSGVPHRLPPTSTSQHSNPHAAAAAIQTGAASRVHGKPSTAMSPVKPSLWNQQPHKTGRPTAHQSRVGGTRARSFTAARSGPPTRTRSQSHGRGKPTTEAFRSNAAQIVSPRRRLEKQDPRVALAQTEGDNSAMLEKVAFERAKRNLLTKRLASVSSTLADFGDRSAYLKKEMKRTEALVKKYSLHSLKHAKSISTLKQKERQIRELMHMQKVSLERLRTMEMESESNPGSGGAASSGDGVTAAPNYLIGTDATPTETQNFRQAAKATECVKKEYQQLLSVRNDLVQDIARLETVDRQRNKTASEANAKMEREKQLARLELERRAAQLRQKEIIRVRENYEKVKRHRLRELKQREQEYASREQERIERLDASTSQSSKHTTEMTTLRISVATTKGQLESASQEAAALSLKVQQGKNDVENYRKRFATAKQLSQRTEMEIKVLKEQPQTALAPIEAERANERKQLNAASGEKAQRVKKLAASVTSLEEELEQLEKVTSSTATAGSPQQDSELDKMENTLKDVLLEIERTHLSVRTTTQEIQNLKKATAKESAAKDSEIERLTRSVSEQRHHVSSLNNENTKLLEQLDAAERLASMNGV